MSRPNHLSPQIIPSAEYPRLFAEYKAGRTMKDLADEYGVSLGAIKRIFLKQTSAIKRPRD